MGVAMKKTANKTTDREFGVILEKIHSEIKIIAESQSLIRDKLDSTMGRVAKHVEDITMLNINVSGIRDDITKIYGKLAKIEDDISLIKSDFGKRISHLEEISLK